MPTQLDCLQLQKKLKKQLGLVFAATFEESEKQGLSFPTCSYRYVKGDSAWASEVRQTRVLLPLSGLLRRQARRQSAGLSLSLAPSFYRYGDLFVYT